MSRTRTAPKNSNVAKRGGLYYTLAIAYIAVSLVSLFLPLTVISGDKLETKFFALFASTEATSGMLGVLSSIVRIAFIGLMLATAALGVLAVLKPEKEESYVSTASLVFVIGCATYTLSIMAGSLTLITLETATFGLDVATLILSVLGLGVYCWLSSKQMEVGFTSNLIQFGLTLGYSILMILSCGTVINEAGFLGVLVLLILAAVIANVIFAAVRLHNDGNLFVDRIRFIGEVVAAGLLFFVTLLGTSTNSGILLALLAIAFGLGEVELIRTKIKRHLKKLAYASRAVEQQEAEDESFEEEANEPYAYARPYGMPAPMPSPFERPMPMPSPMAAAVDPAADPLSGFRVEEYAEALPYEGGPINGVEMAEEVNPTFNPNAAAENQVNTAGYDFYNSKSFDPFIASLDMQERNEFTELFILKYKGVMPEIPDYEVGGDNREFLRKIFIYLGQYRERISSELLNKIYNFSIKLS